MNTLILLSLVATAVADTVERDWSNIKPMDIYVRNSGMKPAKLRNSPAQTRIQGSQVATPHQYPYQAALYIPQGSSTAFCAGSIISPEWILTAAHCVHNSTGTMEVVLGAHNITNKAESTQVKFNSSAYHFHPDWRAQRMLNDIAVVKLSRKISYNKYIQPIRLPAQSEKNTTFVNYKATVCGWGRFSDDSGDYSPELRCFTKSVVTNNYCSLRFLSWIISSHICTANTIDEGLCQGDSGGPLVITDTDGLLTQVGVASFGLEMACYIGWPGVYARVTSHLQWIANNTGIAIRN